MNLLITKENLEELVKEKTAQRDDLIMKVEREIAFLNGHIQMLNDLLNGRESSQSDLPGGSPDGE